MTNPHPAPAPTPAPAAQNRPQLIKDIRSKWMKFSEAQLMTLTSKDALVALVAEKYGLELAQREVDSVLRGRSL